MPKKKNEKTNKKQKTKQIASTNQHGGRRGRVVVEFSTTCAINTYHD